MNIQDICFPPSKLPKPRCRSQLSGLAPPAFVQQAQGVLDPLPTQSFRQEIYTSSFPMRMGLICWEISCNLGLLYVCVCIYYIILYYIKLYYIILH